MIKIFFVVIVSAIFQQTIYSQNLRFEKFIYFHYLLEEFELQANVESVTQVTNRFENDGSYLYNKSKLKYYFDREGRLLECFELDGNDSLCGRRRGFKKHGPPFS